MNAAGRLEARNAAPYSSALLKLLVSLIWRRESKARLPATGASLCSEWLTANSLNSSADYL